MRLALRLAGLAVLAAAGVGVYVSLHTQTRVSGGTTIGSAVPFARLSEPRSVPDVRFQDGAGRTLSLEGFRGKLLLLNIWATWCPPCRKEMPALDRLQAKLGGTDFEVVALSIDEMGAPAVRRFFNEIGVHALKIYVDPATRAADSLGAPGVPTTLLIDRSGRELARHAGPAEWDSAQVVEFLRALTAADRGAGPESR